MCRQHTSSSAAPLPGAQLMMMTLWTRSDCAPFLLSRDSMIILAIIIIIIIIVVVIILTKSPSEYLSSSATSRLAK